MMLSTLLPRTGTITSRKTSLPSLASFVNLVTATAAINPAGIPLDYIKEIMDGSFAQDRFFAYADRQPSNRSRLQVSKENLPPKWITGPSAMAQPAAGSRSSLAKQMFNRLFTKATLGESTARIA